MGDSSDPRLTGEYVRPIAGTPSPVTVVGVVHDHPASVHRVRRTIATLQPDVLALELPPLAVPLFESYARTDRKPPAFGGEMSAAIQAFDGRRTAGIDRPTLGYVLELLRTVLAERPSPTITAKLLSNTVSATTHALICRVAATIADRTSLRLEVDAPTTHDVDRSNTPTGQTMDEETQVRRSRAFTNAFAETSTTRASALEDEARERHMANRLATLARSGGVVAVVGIDHLDAIVDETLCAEPASGRDDADESTPVR